MTKEELSLVIREAGIPGMTDTLVEAVSDALYPLFNPLELSDATLVFEIPMSGTIPDDVLMRYCAYVDLLKKLGAKNAVFIEKGASLSALTERELDRFGLKRKE